MLLGGRAGGVVRRRQRRGGAERVDERVLVLGIDEDAGAARHELGRAADPRRDDGAAEASASSTAWPKGSTSDGWQRTSAAAR